MRYLRLFLFLITTVIFSGCGRPDNSSPGTTSSQSTVPNALKSSNIPGVKFELDAFSTRFGDISPSITGKCPIWIQTLTDTPYRGTVRLLDTSSTNSLPTRVPFLIVANPEDMPYHARFLGHFGGSDFSECDNNQRIFVVDQILQVYEQASPKSSIPDISTWSQFDNSTYLFKFPYPRNATITTSVTSEKDPLWNIQTQEDPNYPISIRIYSQEYFIDPYNRESAPAPVRGGRLFTQESTFFGSSIRSQGLSAYRIDRTDAIGQKISVIFNAGGHAYEVSLVYSPETLQSTLDVYTIIVTSFQLSIPISKTPTTTLQIVPSPDQILPESIITSGINSQIQAQFSTSRDKYIIRMMRLTSDSDMRNNPGCSDYQGHPLGVWIAQVSGIIQDVQRTIEIAVDASSGTILCGYDIGTLLKPQTTTNKTDATSTAVPDIKESITPYSTVTGITPGVLPPDITSTPVFITPSAATPLSTKP